MHSAESFAQVLPVFFRQQHIDHSLWLAEGFEFSILVGFLLLQFGEALLRFFLRRAFPGPTSSRLFFGRGAFSCVRLDWLGFDLGRTLDGFGPGLGR